jgi:hypothetical protein
VSRLSCVKELGISVRYEEYWYLFMLSRKNYPGQLWLSAGLITAAAVHIKGLPAGTRQFEPSLQRGRERVCTGNPKAEVG